MSIQIESNPAEERSTYGPIRLVSIQGTTLCNLNCRYCYLSEEERFKNNVISLDLIDVIFNELATTPFAQGEIPVLWHSSEPMALPLAYYEKIFSRINYVLKRHQVTDRSFSHEFQSNGTLINQAWCDFIKKHNVGIGISLDGPDFLHDKQRVDRGKNPTHERVMRGIRLLQQNDINFGIICVLTKDSLSYPDEIFDFFKNNQIYSFGFNFEEQEGVNVRSSLAEDKTLELYMNFMKRMWQRAKDEKGQIRIREFTSIVDAIIGNPSSPDYQIINQLTEPYMTLNIDYQGNFSTYSPELLTMSSLRYGDFILGNFKTDTLESVLSTEKFKRLNDDVQFGVAQCAATCDYFKLCAGGKPSNKYYENGSFCSTETRECRLREKMLIDLILDDLEMEARKQVHLQNAV
jgi:uncharacterized protein